MQLLYISPSYIPSRNANSVHVMKFCFALSKKVNSLTLLCKSFSSAKSINDFSFYGVGENSFKILKFKIRKENKFYSLIYSLWTFFKIVNINCDFIYSRNQLSDILILLFSNKKIIVELHSPPNKIYRAIYKIFLKTIRIKKIITISNELKKIILDDFRIKKTEKIIVAHDGADLLDFRKLKKINFNINNFKCKHIGYVGHLYKGRGIDIIIKLSSIYKKHIFHIIGGNETDINYWKNKCKNKNIIFYGFINPNMIPSYLISFDILIAPYQNKVFISNGMDTSKWMSPLKLFEYMSVRKPILTSKIKVLSEIFQHKVNAYLCRPSVFEDWDKGLEYFLYNPTITNEIAKTAHNNFINHYTWSSRAEFILSKLD